MTLAKTNNEVIVFEPIEKGSDETFWYNEAELKKFFSVIPPTNQRDTILFLTALGTGKRVTEFISIKKNDINFELRLMRVIALKKRKKTIEYIRLHQDLAYKLAVYCASMKAEEKVFKITRQRVDQIVKKYAQLSGLTHKRASIHNFRHTFAIRWLEQGKPINKLQKHLGHKFMQTTAKYLKIVDSDYNKTVDELNMFGFLKNE